MSGTEIELDVYAVGLLRDWQVARRTGQYRSLWYWFTHSWTRRSYWNGYLAEHAHCAHNAGRGWTRRAAKRRVARICAAGPVVPASRVMGGEERG